MQAEKAAIKAQVNRLRRMHERQMARVSYLYEIEAYALSLQSPLIEAVHQQAIAAEKVRELTGMPLRNPELLVQETFPEA